VLEYLVRRRGAVVSRADIERHIYDDPAELMSNAVDSAICALRRKIELPGKPSLIRTRRGMGYVLQAGEQF
jgi:DNA-binding response OmpR family regulator